MTLGELRIALANSGKPDGTEVLLARSSYVPTRNGSLVLEWELHEVEVCLRSLPSGEVLIQLEPGGER